MIDWFKDDGVNLAMLNDHIRNRFYDDVMRGTVSGQKCLEIGFGTGILSILALKHGAEHVVAFECDNERYQLGKSIIDTLKLNDKITLVHERYHHQTLEDHSDISVVFSEIVSQNLFGEQIWNTIPRSPVKQSFLPRYLGMDVMAYDVSDAMARGIDKNVLKFSSVGFNPGVDLDHRFIYHINDLIGNTADISQAFAEVPAGGRKIQIHHSTDWNTQPWRSPMLINSRRVAGYSIDIQQQTLNRWDQHHLDSLDAIDFSQDNITLSISPSWKNQNVVLWPRLWLATDHHRLEIDTGHWAPVDPYLFVRHQEEIAVTHDFITGKITVQ